MDNIKKSVLEQITRCLAGRIEQSYMQNEKYKQCIKDADLIFEKLDDSLNDEQAELLENYFTANNAAVSLAKKLIYQQGMTDLLNLLVSPPKNPEA